MFLASGDTSADVLDGGDGKVTMVGDNGDIMVGGEGVDAFAVQVTDGMSPAVITDFDPGTESLEVVAEPGEGSTITLFNMMTPIYPQAVAVVLDSVIVAYLPDLRVEDIDPASVTLRVQA